MGNGSVPSANDHSTCIYAQYSKGRWAEASDMLNIIVDKGIALNDFCCYSLVSYYCRSGLVDSAIALHAKLKSSGGCFGGSLLSFVFGGSSFCKEN